MRAGCSLQRTGWPQPDSGRLQEASPWVPARAPGGGGGLRTGMQNTQRKVNEDA